MKAPLCVSHNDNNNARILHYLLHIWVCLFEYPGGDVIGLEAFLCVPISLLMRCIWGDGIRWKVDVTVYDYYRYITALGIILLLLMWSATPNLSISTGDHVSMKMVSNIVFSHYKLTTTLSSVCFAFHDYKHKIWWSTTRKLKSGWGVTANAMKWIESHQCLYVGLWYRVAPHMRAISRVNKPFQVRQSLKSCTSIKITTTPAKCFAWMERGRVPEWCES